MLTTSEILVSETHIDPKRDEGFIIYKLGYINPVAGGARETSMLWGNAKQADNVQAGILTALASRSVSVIFTKAFTSIPVGRKNIHAYRLVEPESGLVIDQDVLFHSLVVTTTGFTLTIDQGEALTGIIIEYHFTKTN